MMARSGSWRDRCCKIALAGATLLVTPTIACWQPPSVALAGQKSNNAEAQRDELLAERNRLWDEARGLAAKGQFDEAIEVAQRTLAIERRLYGEVHTELASSLEWIAGTQERREDFEAAVETRTQLLAMRRKLYGEKDWRVTDARLALAGAQQLGRFSADERSAVRRFRQLNSRTIQLYRQGAFRQAVEPATEALNIAKKVLGEEHPDYATSLDNLAAMYRSLADYARAEPLQQQAIEVRKKVLGEAHPKYAQSLNNLALLYQSTGDYARAEPLYRQVLEITKKVLGEEHPDYATSLNNLAALYVGMGDYARAEPLYRQAVEIRKKVLGEKHPHYALSLNNLAYLYYSMADYARAEPLYQQALTIRKEVLGEKHPDYAASLHNLAALYDSMGDYAGAEPLYQQALTIAKDRLGEQHPDYATSINNLAYVYYRMGDYARAEPLYRQALNTTAKALGEDHPRYATCLNNLAALYHDMGDYARAEPLYQQVLKITRKALGEEHPATARSLDNLAELYRTMDDYARAQPLFQQALAIRKKAFGEEHPSTATSLNNLAALYDDMGDDARAEPLYQQALKIKKKVLGEEHPDYALGLNNLAYLYTNMGDYARAEPLYQQALAIRKKVLGEEHPDYAISLYNLAWLYQRTGDEARAAPLLRQSLSSTYKLLELTAAVQSERQQLAMMAQMRRVLDGYLSAALQDNLAPEEAYAFALSWKGRVFQRQQQVRLARRQPELKSSFDDLDATTSRLATLALATPTPQQREARDRQLRELSIEKERLEAALSGKSAAFRQALHPIAPADLVSALPKGAALVDFLEYTHFAPPQNGKGDLQRERRLAAFVVRPQAPLVRIELGATEPLAGAIDTWRKSYGRSEEAEQAARQIRERIWEPLEAHLADAEIVLLSPDGALGRFPLAALPGSRPGSYLLEEHPLAIVPVPQALPSLLNGERPNQVAGNLLVLGGVDYDANPAARPDEPAPPRKSFGRLANRGVARAGGREKFAYLEGTAGEVARIKDLYGKFFGAQGLTSLEGAAAGEAAVRREVERHQYLHLATHGYFAPPELRSALSAKADESAEAQRAAAGEEFAVTGFHPGLLSGLALAGANLPPAEDAEGYDGILAAEEVAALDLGGVDVAVLSACQTGLGQTAGGEGLLGLQRAFQVAGACTVVATLWKVDDRATRDLMERFYANLWERDMGTLAALREAQLWMLDKRGPRGLDIATEDKQPRRLPPYYWAAFVLSGDWR